MLIYLTIELIIHKNANPRIINSVVPNEHCDDICLLINSEIKINVD
jgi:hypothetical protein